MPIFNGVIISEAQLAEAGYTKDLCDEKPCPSQGWHNCPKCNQTKPKFGRVKPNNGQEFSLVTQGGHIDTLIWSDLNAHHLALWNMGNFYLTREAEELAIARQQAKVRVIDKLAELKEHELDWGDNDQVKYILLIDHEESVVRTEDWRSYQFAELELYSTINACEYVATHMSKDVKLMLTGERNEHR